MPSASAFSIPIRILVVYHSIPLSYRLNKDREPLYHDNGTYCLYYTNVFVKKKSERTAYLPGTTRTRDIKWAAMPFMHIEEKGHCVLVWPHSLPRLLNEFDRLPNVQVPHPNPCKSKSMILYISLINN